MIVLLQRLKTYLQQLQWSQTGGTKSKQERGKVDERLGEDRGEQEKEIHEIRIDFIYVFLPFKT